MGNQRLRIRSDTTTDAITLWAMIDDQWLLLARVYYGTGYYAMRELTHAQALANLVIPAATHYLLAEDAE